MSKFAQKLKELRIENNLTLKQLSKELGGKISSSALQYWETNQRIPIRYVNISRQHIFESGIHHRKEKRRREL